jgi:hypothetical protein
LHTKIEILVAKQANISFRVLSRLGDLVVLSERHKSLTKIEIFVASIGFNIMFGLVHLHDAKCADIASPLRLIFICTVCRGCSQETLLFVVL